jgi:hypothetical protein
MAVFDDKAQTAQALRMAESGQAAASHPQLFLDVVGHDFSTPPREVQINQTAYATIDTANEVAARYGLGVAGMAAPFGITMRGGGSVTQYLVVTPHGGKILPVDLIQAWVSYGDGQVSQYIASADAAAGGGPGPVTEYRNPVTGQVEPVTAAPTVGYEDFYQALNYTQISAPAVQTNTQDAEIATLEKEIDQLQQRYAVETNPISRQFLQMQILQKQARLAVLTGKATMGSEQTQQSPNPPNTTAVPATEPNQQVSQMTIQERVKAAAQAETAAWDVWNYYYAQITGSQAPAPEERGFSRAPDGTVSVNGKTMLTVDEWWAAAFGSAPGGGSKTDGDSGTVMYPGVVYQKFDLMAWIRKVLTGLFSGGAARGIDVYKWVGR